MINLNKYVGKIILIVYLGRNGQITQRRISVQSIDGVSIRAYCYTRQAPRVFRLDNILAAMPVKEGVTA